MANDYAPMRKRIWTETATDNSSTIMVQFLKNITIFGSCKMVYCFRGHSDIRCCFIWHFMLCFFFFFSFRFSTFMCTLCTLIIIISLQFGCDVIEICCFQRHEFDLILLFIPMSMCHGSWHFELGYFVPWYAETNCSYYYYLSVYLKLMYHFLQFILHLNLRF